LGSGEEKAEVESPDIRDSWRDTAARLVGLADKMKRASGAGDLDCLRSGNAGEGASAPEIAGGELGSRA
jgi:hypothetical protein